MPKPAILILHWLPDGQLARWTHDFPQYEFIDARQPDVRARHKNDATIVYGFTDLEAIAQPRNVRWVQLASAGVPHGLCPLARQRGMVVSNLAGLYGPTIAEHALALMLMLRRNLHLALRNQMEKQWDRSLAESIRDLHRQTLAIVGLGNIGQNIARLGRAFGMQIVGCRRRPQPTPYVDRVVGRDEVASILREANVVALAAPLTPATEGMLGPTEFAAMRVGSLYINVSRGAIAQEAALVEALRSAHLAGAGLDVFAAEPLVADHPLWAMPNVVITPHYSGETVNNSSLPAQRFTRNLHRYLANEPLEGMVDLEHGY